MPRSRGSRSMRSWTGPLRMVSAILRLLLVAALGCGTLAPHAHSTSEDLDAETQNYEIQDHLDHDEHPGALAGCRDVTEPDSGEDRQGEVERIGPGELVGAEVGCTVLRQHDIRRRVQHQ